MTIAASVMLFMVVLVAFASIGLRVMDVQRKTGSRADPSPGGLYCPKCGHGGPAADFCKICGFNFAPIKSTPPPLPSAAKAGNKGFLVSIQDEGSARQAARQGMWAAFFCSGATTLAVFLNHSGKLLMAGISDWSLIDALVFALLGGGMAYLSRAAAIAALGLYLIERVFIFSQNGGAGAPIVVIIGVVFCFVNAIRGTFAFHNFREPGPQGAILE